MKFFAFILSIYILTLNLAPCSDYSVSDNESKTEISQLLDTDTEHQDLDFCSPFCNCHCCHIHATHFRIAEFTVDETEIPTNIFFYYYGIEKNFNNSILQPPQV